MNSWLFQHGVFSGIGSGVCHHFGVFLFYFWPFREYGKSFLKLGSLFVNNTAFVAFQVLANLKTFFTLFKIKSQSFKKWTIWVGGFFGGLLSHIRLFDELIFCTLAFRSHFVYFCLFWVLKKILTDSLLVSTSLGTLVPGQVWRSLADGNGPMYGPFWLGCHECPLWSSFGSSEPWPPSLQEPFSPHQ